MSTGDFRGYADIAEREAKLMELEKYAGEGAAHATELVRSRYEQAANPEDNLDFHNTEHTGGVTRRTVQIIEAATEGTSAEYRRIVRAQGTLAASFHDTKQNYKVQYFDANNTEVKTEEGSVRAFRKRDTGQNEAESGAEARAFMEQTNMEHPGTFTEEDI
jgi:hypothetical protein